MEIYFHQSILNIPMFERSENNKKKRLSFF